MTVERQLVHAKVTLATHDTLRQLARDGERTLAGELRLAVRNHIAAATRDHDDDPPAGRAT
jgi:hypothetical protein